MKEISLNKEDSVRIISLFKEGESLRGISRYTKYSQTFITNFLNKEGLINNGYEKIKHRFKENINYEAICKKTNKTYDDYLNLSGKLTTHIKEIYPDFVLESKFLRKKTELKIGKFWYEDFFVIKEKIEKNEPTLNCLICDWSSSDLNNQAGSLTKHIVNTHNIDIDEYLKKFNDQGFLFKTHLLKKEDRLEVLSKGENHIICKICNEPLKSITNTHLKKHGISIKKYKKIFGETINSESTINKLKLNSGNFNNFKFKNTKIEILISNKLSELKIDFIPQKQSDGYVYDFFVPEYGLFIECDGIFWHGHDRDSNWHYSVFNNVINDYRKTIIKPKNKIYRLIEDISINENNLKNINSKDEFFNFLIRENFNIENHTIFNLKENVSIFDIDRCIKNRDLIDDKNKNNLIQNIVFLWKNFYNHNQCEKFLDLDNRKAEFKLKGIFFKEFYTAKKIGNKNIDDFFNNDNDEILKKIVEYRLGFNNSNEYFDLNIKNLYRGLEVRSMFNVGIFYIKQSKEIYEKYVENENSKIYDPFIGWGSRLTSLKNLIKNKNCKYIGNDINKNLKIGYSKLIDLEFDLESHSNIDINFKTSTELNIELVDGIDFIFTSPPFYNDEIYSYDSLVYEDLKDWEDNLLTPVFNNCFLYLKTNSRIVIDIKELYTNSILSTLEKSGFKIVEIENYNVRKSHYTKKDTKKQLLIHAVKI